MRTLVVDDNPEYSELLQLAFSDFGPVDIVSNGTEGFKAFCSALKSDTPYDLICLDMNMPMRDGYETIQSIRFMEKKLLLNGSLGVKIIIVTGYPDHARTNLALLSGAEALIAKSEGVNRIIEKAKELGLTLRSDDQAAF